MRSILLLFAVLTAWIGLGLAGSVQAADAGGQQRLVAHAASGLASSLSGFPRWYGYSYGYVAVRPPLYYGVYYRPYVYRGYAFGAYYYRPPVYVGPVVAPYYVPYAYPYYVRPYYTYPMAYYRYGYYAYPSYFVYAYPYSYRMRYYGYW